MSLEGSAAEKAPQGDAQGALGVDTCRLQQSAVWASPYPNKSCRAFGDPVDGKF